MHAADLAVRRFPPPLMDQRRYWRCPHRVTCACVPLALLYCRQSSRRTAEHRLPPGRIQGALHLPNLLLWRPCRFALARRDQALYAI
ncbi:unnamed protein product [Mycena citricolor]|uniref:Uncharacterized protein n=1 Tax=Mycena citricolor TaxID=2018698 RepID=A0AAD2HH56_9AGAR|nr:unnamed protein product [Mycena citricolor]